MNFSKKSEALFYIDKNKGLFLTNVPKSKSLELDIPKNAFSHLEIVSTEKLTEFIREFLKNKKIEPMNVFILLGKNTTFEKDISGIPASDRHSEINKFLDIVPFEETQSKTFKIQKKEKIIVVNKNFCQEINNIFEEEGFSVLAITSVSTLEEIIPKLKDEFSLLALLNKTNIIKQYSLISSSENRERSYTNYMSSFKNTRLVILTGIFVILLIILFIFSYNRFLGPQSKPSLTPTVYTRQQAVTPNPQASESATPSAKITPTK